MRKYPDRQKGANNLEHDQDFYPMVNPKIKGQSGKSQSKSSSCELLSSELISILESDDTLDLPIGLRKCTRTCTKYPLCNFLSYQNLSPLFQTLFYLKIVLCCQSKEYTGSSKSS